MEQLQITHKIYEEPWDGLANILFTAKYDAHTNCTTITFDLSNYYYYGLSGWGTEAKTELTITPDDNPVGAKSAEFSIRDVTTNGGLKYFYGTPSPATVTVQHKSWTGDKFVTITGKSTIYVYFVEDKRVPATGEASMKVKLEGAASGVVYVGDRVGIVHVGKDGAWHRGLMCVGSNGEWKSSVQGLRIFRNMSRVAGKALVSRDGDGNEVYTEYGVGQMPLSFTAHIEGSIGHGTLIKGNNLNDVYFCPEARAGDFLEFYLTFPEYGCDYAEVDGLLNQWIYLCGVLPEDAQNQPMTYMGWHQYSGGWGTTNEPSSSRDRLMGDDFFFELIQDASGVVTGLHCSGTLLYDLDCIYFNGTLNYELPIYDDQGKTNVAKGNNLTRFASYNDFRYRVVKGG